MGNFTVSQDKQADVTVLSNRFIDEYMIDANDAQLKIYLYLLRAMSAGRGASISDIADIFNYTEKDVMRALKYWERKKLLALSYDDAKNLRGLRFLPMPASENQAPEAFIVPYPAAVSPAVSLLQEKKAEAEAPAADPYEKPNYSLDQLKAFKESETTSRLLFITEQYLKKTLSPNEMKTIFFISDKLGFSEELIDYLIQYCVGHDKKDLRYIEKVAINWAQSGVTTPKQAARYVSKYDRTVYDIMNALGKNTIPTAAEVVFINRWTKEYAFDTEIIRIACERTVLATDKHRFEYADKILLNWHKAGVKHAADIERLDAGFRKQTKASAKPGANAFTGIEQHDYDFEALEKELLSN